MSFTPVTVTATYVRGPEQTPANGEVEFRYDHAMQDQAGNVIASTTPFVVVLDATGSLSVVLPATDDVSVVPTGVALQITERIEDAAERRYRITLPNATPAINLADVSPAIIANPVYNYALAGHAHTLDSLSDVFVPTPIAGDVVTWDAVDGRWEAAPTGAASHPNLASHDAMGLATDVELASHIAAGDPHPVYETSAESAAKVTAHEGAANPHPTYHTAAEVATDIATHAAAVDPHPTYATDTDLTNHAGAADPHTGYQRESEKGAASGYASLGADVLVPQDQLGTGVQDGTKFLRDDGTWQAVPSGYTDEQAQDAVGAMLLDTATIDLVYVDATPALSADVKAGSITTAMLAFDPATQVELDAHLNDTTDAHDASAISFVPNGSIAATDVQAAIQEVRDEAAGGLAPSTADYLVGTAQAGLSAEIVVGTTPGGELGGTWAAPTVDAVHSGSTHAATQAAAEATAAAALAGHVAAADPHTGYVLESALDESVDDRVAVLIQNGTGIGWTYNDVANTLTPAVTLAPFTTTALAEGTNLYHTTERAQDAIGGAVVDSASVDVTYDDTANTFTWVVLPAGVDHNALANLTTGDPHTQYVLGSVLSESIDDRVSALLTEGAGIDLVYNDVGNSLSITVDLSELSTTTLVEGTNLYFTDERAQDAVGTMATDTASVNVTYVDATPALTWDVLPAGVNHNALANLTTGDPHTLYALLAGRAGGQTLRGGTAASEALTLKGTNHATRGPVNIDDIVRVLPTSATYTASLIAIQTPTTATHTLDFVNANATGFFLLGTFVYEQAGAAGGAGAAVRTLATYKNPAGEANSLGSHFLFQQGNVYQADSQAITLPTYVALTDQAVMNVIGGGTLAVTAYETVRTIPNIGTGVTVTLLNGIHVYNPAGAGVITTLCAVDIEPLTRGTTNIGIRNASTTVNTPPAVQSITAATQAITVASTTKLIDANASYTLTATPTIADGQNGQVVTIFNTDTGSDVITLQDQATLAGSNLRLRTPTRSLGPRESITLQYLTTVGDWVELSSDTGFEVGYAEITGAVTSTATTDGTSVDATGLIITVNVGSRPIMLEFWGEVSNSVAGSGTAVMLVEAAAGDANRTPILTRGSWLSPAANSPMPFYLRVRLAPTPGSHTYKVQMRAATSGTASITGAATKPAHIQATAV